MAILEKGVIAGNSYDKYGTKNPISRYLMKGFIDSVNELVSIANVSDIHEIGCGEGHLSTILAKTNKDRKVRASDFSFHVIEEAQNIAQKVGVNIDFRIASIHDLIPNEDAAELVVCCEVLEHLDDPNGAMDKLAKLARPYLLLSVPREPIWRILNIMRGKYIRNFGNTPGHMQHWSKMGVLRMVERYVDILEIRTPLPWVIALCRIKNI